MTQTMGELRRQFHYQRQSEMINKRSVLAWDPQLEEIRLERLRISWKTQFSGRRFYLTCSRLSREDRYFGQRLFLIQGIYEYQLINISPEVRDTGFGKIRIEREITQNRYCLKRLRPTVFIENIPKVKTGCLEAIDVILRDVWPSESHLSSLMDECMKGQCRPHILRPLRQYEMEKWPDTWGRKSTVVGEYFRQDHNENCWIVFGRAVSAAPEFQQITVLKLERIS